MRPAPRPFWLAALLVMLAFALAPRAAKAEPPPADLMARLATYSAAVDRMRTHASYVLEGELDAVDGDGKVSGVRTLKVRIEANGERIHAIVIKYTEDGEDKTEEGRKKAHESDSKSKEERDKNRLDLPFLASQQPHYTFNQVAVDAADPARVQISFVPIDPDEHSTEGSVWVDTKEGTILSAGFKVSKPGFLVDYLRFTLVFGAATELGPAISKVTMEGKGGILFIQKRFRGEATLSDYRIVP